MARLASANDLEKLRQATLAQKDAKKPCISICSGTGCLAFGTGKIIAAFKADIQKQGLQAKVDLKEIGCPGFCEHGTVVVVHPAETCYVQVKEKDISEILSKTVKGEVIDRLLYTDPVTGKKIANEADIPFYKNQNRLLLANNAKIDPRKIEDYIALGGYTALTKAFSMSPAQVVEEIKKSDLRGRSGGGFRAGVKWEACRKAEGDTKYIICNCHEGDPGAFVDRRMMEGNPHNIIEGMAIGAYAIGAHEGYIFVGEEFPLTVENTEIAIKQAEELGLLGKNILGSGFDFTLKISIDAGSYVCGESTALMACIEGRVGEPLKKYDHATERGLWAKPTDLNNLQTWANVPMIIQKGADWFTSVGTKTSKGTRVFSLVGKINNTGMVEVPMGMTLREVIFNIGGGIRDGKKFKAVQVGGPLGGFAPESLLDVPVDYEEMNKAGLAMGPGLIVLDENVCMVDTVNYFLTFLANESCGKCSPCREGITQMLNILSNILHGKGKESDIETLEAIAAVQQKAALCALGQGASSPLISALKHFRSEFEAHIKEKRCPAQVCKISATVVS